MMILIITVGLLIGYYTIRWVMGLLTIDDFESRNVFITGCDSGFGNLLAKRLDSMGFSVFAGCLTDEGADDLKNEAGLSSKLITIKLDTTNEEQIQNAFTFICNTLSNTKGLWAVVNNAGISSFPAPAEWFTSSEYDRVMRVNVYGMIDVCRTFLPLIRKARGRIINCSSLSGRLSVGVAPYCVSKYGVEAYSDCLRRELYIEGISVHIIEPLTFKTPIIRDLPERLKTAFNQTTREMQVFYGPAYMEKSCAIMCKMVEKMANPNSYLVVDDYVHAVTSRFPRARYMPGDYTKYLFWIIWNLPEWISDWAISLVLNVKPAGAK